jgi:RNA polymerase sigma-70 factor (sigma-E family)
MTTDRNDPGSTHEDDFLARLYQEIADTQAPQYAATYQAGAQLARFNSWLQAHTVPGRHQTEAATTESSQAAARPSSVTEARVTGSIATVIKAGVDAIPAPFRPMPAKLESDADQAVTQLYSNHYRSLVRLAGLLVRDEQTAQEVVQDCFIALHHGWHRLRDEDKALSYLKQAVVNRSRSVLRHRHVTDRNTPKSARQGPDSEQDPIMQLERTAVIAALRALPDRQRQTLVLRYYADLSEAQIADMMGISKGAVRSHTARGMSSLRAILENAP